MEAATPAAPKAGALARVGAVVLALVVAFIAAAVIIAMVDIMDTGTCAEVITGEAEPNSDGECYDGSTSTRTITGVLGIIGGAIAALSALMMIGFAARGRGARPMFGALAVGAVLIALALLIG